MQQSIKHTHKHVIQRGYSLVELSVALAIVAVILVGALVGTRQLLLSNSVNNQVKEMAVVIAKVQRHFVKQNTTTGATTQTLAPLSVWPAERAAMANNNWSVRGVLNGSSEFISSNTAPIGTLPTAGGFLYTLRQVPVDACADLVTALDPLSFAIYAGPTRTSEPDGSTPTTLTVVKAADSSAVSMTMLATGCAPASGGIVDIAVVFRQ